MLIASLHSMFETTFILMILFGIVVRLEARKFAAKHPDVTKKGVHVLGSVIFRHLSKW